MPSIESHFLCIIAQIAFSTCHFLRDSSPKQQIVKVILLVNHSAAAFTALGGNSEHMYLLLRQNKTGLSSFCVVAPIDASLQDCSRNKLLIIVPPHPTEEAS